MIICHRHRFIFIKTKKSAGTSVEIALSRFCGDCDVITEVSPEDEPLRAELAGRSSQKQDIPWRQWRSWDVIQALRRRSWPRYRKHTSAAWLRRRLPSEIWDGYYKFCVDRNPWDRAISAYYWRTRSARQRPSLEAWLGAVPARQLSNHSLYSIDGRVAVDRVLRFEHLAADLKEVAHELGLPGELELPFTKHQVRVDRRPYQELLGPAYRARIARVCAREIEQLGYEF